MWELVEHGGEDIEYGLKNIDLSNAGLLVKMAVRLYDVKQDDDNFSDYLWSSFFIFSEEHADHIELFNMSLTSYSGDEGLLSTEFTIDYFTTNLFRFLENWFIYHKFLR